MLRRFVKVQYVEQEFEDNAVLVAPAKQRAAFSESLRQDFFN